MEEILEWQLHIRGWAFATFVTIEKVLACRKKSFRRLHVAYGLYVAQACSILYSIHTTVLCPCKSHPCTPSFRSHGM